jgi:hypothetical protein
MTGMPPPVREHNLFDAIGLALFVAGADVLAAVR